MKNCLDMTEKKYWFPNYLLITYLLTYYKIYRRAVTLKNQNMVHITFSYDKFFSYFQGQDNNTECNVMAAYTPQPKKVKWGFLILDSS